jgi:hypothetical protein
MKIRVHKIASVTANLKLEKELTVTSEIESRSGNVLVVRALSEKSVYDKIELDSGRMAHISRDDLIAGALGTRHALRGFVGEVPESIRAGDRLQILNLGGVIGVCVSGHPELGPPLPVEVLGMAVNGGGRPLNIAEGAIQPSDTLDHPSPIVLVAGTCMASGKTRAACELIQKMNQEGQRLAGAKLTGVACLRDVLNMQDHGARAGFSFQDAGLASTVAVPDLARVAKGILNRASGEGLDATVVELGDGIIGDYGVRDILRDEEIRARIKALVLCANDLVAAWGAAEWMRREGLRIDVLSGPATDNDVGVRYISRELKIPAINARADATKLAEKISALVF